MVRFLLVMFLFSLPLSGADQVGSMQAGSEDTAGIAAVQQENDTAAATVVAPEAAAAAPDTVQKENPEPSQKVARGTVQPPDKPATASATSVKKIKLRKRDYNYRQQVLLAIGMMAFIAIMMTTAQSLNPK